MLICMMLIHRQLWFLRWNNSSYPLRKCGNVNSSHVMSRVRMNGRVDLIGKIQDGTVKCKIIIIKRLVIIDRCSLINGFLMKSTLKESWML